ncbi:neurotrypsin-like [Lemur catta]|uniref:neurotrypsin-like n=1 Tax=Lemur catta TaxID=9447 RepID=UPI001E268A43|nr:neurotrypsin-like [Lemur catta]
MALLRCCLLWLLLPIGCGTQKLPTRDEELFQMQIRDKAFFHDSSVIPDRAEISSYLFRDTLKRYFFVVEEDNTPLSVTVTPCDVPLEWKLSLQELPEETSGEGSGATEMRQTNFRCLIRNPVFPQWHRQSVEWGVFWRRFRPVVLDEVRCTGNELSVEQCARSSWGQHDCAHGEDAGVSCTPVTDGAIRLAGGKGSHEGRLEVYHQGQWGSVSDDGWTVLNTYVVCRQLGFKYGKQTSANHFPESMGPIWLDDVTCSGKETSFLDCSRKPWGRHDCGHRKDVGVSCYPGSEGHRLSLGFPLRLVYGENKKEGCMEVFIHGQWGTICDDGWSDKDAAVVCRQLGFKGPARARGVAYFGEGAGPIHVDNVKCTGHERSLADCIKQDIGRHNCRHSEDAGVICDYSGKKASGNSKKGPLASVCGLRLLHRQQKRIIGGKNSLRISCYG